MINNLDYILYSLLWNYLCHLQSHIIVFVVFD